MPGPVTIGYVPGARNLPLVATDISRVEKAGDDLKIRGFSLEREIIPAGEANSDDGSPRMYATMAFLLRSSRLPTKAEASAYVKGLSEKRQIDSGGREAAVKKWALFIKGFQDLPEGSRWKPPVMTRLGQAIGRYPMFKSTDDQTPFGYRSAQADDHDLLAKMPVFTALSYLKNEGHLGEESAEDVHQWVQETVDAGMGQAETLLHLIGRGNGELAPGSQVDRPKVKILDLILTVLAEHGGGNASTFSVRHATSAQVNFYKAMQNATNTLSGARHGGANVKVADMMSELLAREGDTPAAYISRKVATAKAQGERAIFGGFGHGQYESKDPRADLLKAMARELCRSPELKAKFRVWESMETAVKDFLYQKTKEAKCTNVDYWSAFVLKEILGVDTELYTAIFATARAGGWKAHIREADEDPIFRPACEPRDQQAKKEAKQKLSRL